MVTLVLFVMRAENFHKWEKMNYQTLRIILKKHANKFQLKFQRTWRLPFGQRNVSTKLQLHFAIQTELATYTPRVISIGPFHHDSEKLRPMKIQKQRYLKEFCKRLRGKTKEQVQESLNVLLSTIEDEKDEIKRRYADNTFEFSSDDDQFVKMILFDAVFIFELFLKNEEHMRDNKRYQDDFIIGKPWLRAAIQRDLILLENQLPFSFSRNYIALPSRKQSPIIVLFWTFPATTLGSTVRTKPSLISRCISLIW